MGRRRKRIVVWLVVLFTHPRHRSKILRLLSKGPQRKFVVLGW